MLKIRLRRMGAKKAPFYRIVVADSRAPRDGAFVEEIGYYNPIANPAEIKVDNEKGTVELRFIPRTTAMITKVLMSTDLVTWTEITAGVTFSDTVVGQETVMTLPKPDAVKAFFKLAYTYSGQDGE